MASHRLASAEVSVTTQRSLSTNTPGVVFGVWANGYSAATGQTVDGLPAIINLLKNRTDSSGNETPELDVVPGISCRISTGENWLVLSVVQTNLWLKFIVKAAQMPNVADQLPKMLQFTRQTGLISASFQEYIVFVKNVYCKTMNTKCTVA